MQTAVDFKSRAGTKSGLVSFRLVLCGLVSLACVACGREGGESREVDAARNKSSASVAVCDLVSRDQVATALGSAVGEPREQVISTLGADRAGIAECTYTATDAPRKSVSLFLRQSPAPDNNPGSMRETLTSSGVTVTDEAGIGDTAFWDGAKLHVFSGRQIYFAIAIAGVAPEADARAHARELALAALARIRAVRVE